MLVAKGDIMRKNLPLLFTLFAVLCIAASWYDDCPVLSDPSDGTGPWSVATPESQGVNKATLESGVAYLAQDKDVYSVLVLRNGKMIHESYYHGADAKTSCNVHSASKSVLSPLLLCLVEDGILSSVDTPVCEILPEYFADYPNNDPRRRITVDHLMTMTSGLAWEEDATEYQIDNANGWVQAILDLGMATIRKRSGRRGYTETPVQPGEKGNYSTGDAHLASACIQRLTGLTTAEYAQVRLYNKLGIEPERWLSDPEGVSMGGCCQYLTARELAAFGQMFLDGGKNLSGQQVLSPAVVALCFQPCSTVDGCDYCRFWWTWRISDQQVYVAYGWGGQMVYVIPSLKTVFVMTADTARDGYEPEHERFVERYLIPSISGSSDRDRRRRRRW
jgi:CubicO group peptidase (beta-lactamase class C family)